MKPLNLRGMRTVLGTADFSEALGAGTAGPEPINPRTARRAVFRAAGRTKH
jgi:hypothetical protein